MKLILNILTMLLLVLPAHAEEDIVGVAQSVAKRYCQNPTLKKTGSKPSSSLLRSADIPSPSYFIFSDDAADKFCIVSADGGKVLGYGDNYSDTLPPQLQAALDMYATSPQSTSELRSATVRKDIPPFVDVVYGTRSPYNIYIPRREGSGPPVGCVPVVLAQICKYYEHPSKLMDDIPAYAHVSATNPDTVYQIEGQKAEGRTYDWNLILNHYEKDTTDELNNEIAKLMSDCARSVETAFEQSGSSALTDMFFYSAIHYFGYNSDSIRMVSRNTYYREDWLDLIHEELSKKRPIYMSGTSYSNGGHAFLCDGYINGYLHINWGWNGASNGYFDVDILDYKHGHDREQTSPDKGYSFFEKIIIGIEPGEGKKEYKRPESSKSIVKAKDEGVTVDVRYRATDDGFAMYTSLDYYMTEMDEDILYALGYVDKNGKISFLGNGKSGYFTSDNMTLQADSKFDSSYLGKEITLYVLQSDKDKVEPYVQDTMYEWWHPSELFDSVVVTIPDTVVNDDKIIEPVSLEVYGEYADSSITLNVTMQTERQDGCMRYYALALVVDGDTLMSSSTSDVNDYSDDPINFKSTFKDPALDTEMTLLLMQADEYTHVMQLDLKDWNVCANFTPRSFKLSDCTIFSKEFNVDTIIHTSNGTKQRFEITFSNPTQYEFYNDVYFLVDNVGSGAMVSIPAGGSTTKIIERETPVLTRYINGLIKVYNNFDVASSQAYTKDTFSHVFYGLKGGDETTIALQVLNGTNANYENTFILRSDSDTVAMQSVVIEPLRGAQLNYNMPVIVSDTLVLRVNYNIYSFYDKDETYLGSFVPMDYYGRILQSYKDDDILISLDLWPVNDTILPQIVIGLASSVEDTSNYQRLMYVPKPKSKSVSLEFWLSEYSRIEKPRYIGLCKEDGTFYAYMELVWETSSPVVASSGISIIASSGGIWIYSDVEIPLLPIYNVNGKLMKTVGLKPHSTLFTPLPKGVYVVGNQKVLVK